jgi:hypothetical protein
MFVQFAYVRCPACGSAFEAGNSIAPIEDGVQPSCSPANQSGQCAVISKTASVLHSWKDIASYVGRGVRTVQRWEHDYGLPVHRPNQRERSAVLAFPEEIKAWLHHTPVGLQLRPTVLDSGKKTVMVGARALHNECA